MASVHHNLDRDGGKIIEGIGNLGSFPLQVTEWLIEKLKLPDINEYRNDLPTLIDIAMRVYNAFYTYHQKILDKTKDWSNDIKNSTARVIKLILYPISFCYIGEALRDTIAVKFLGNIARAVSFVVFQILHIIPYLLIGFTFTGIHFLYQTAPEVLLGAITVTFLYLTYRLVKEIELSNKILTEKLDQVNNGVEWVKGTYRSAKENIKYSLYKCASFTQRQLKACYGSKDKKV